MLKEDELYDENGDIIDLPGRKYCPLNIYWAISRYGINLIQERSVECEKDPLEALRYLSIEPSQKNLDLFFPRNFRGARCPTFELMRLWHRLGKRINKSWSSNV